MYGHALRRLKRYDEALAFWKTVLAEEPKNEVAQREAKKLETLLQGGDVPEETAEPIPPAAQ